VNDLADRSVSIAGRRYVIWYPENCEVVVTTWRKEQSFLLAAPVFTLIWNVSVSFAERTVSA
jgi:hypothetical protein